MLDVCSACREARKNAVAGQAFTYYKCSICGKRELWHNTAVPMVCCDCAEKKKVCVYCGERIFPEVVKQYEQ